MKSKEVAEYIVDWLDNYCEKSGLKGFAVGISGGIDSALTSTLCARTGKPTYILSMPIYQQRDQLTLAEQHMDWLREAYPNVKTEVVDLSDAFDSLKKIYPAEIQDGLTMANTRSRLRMVTLYSFATHHRLLVAGTGNKVEDFGVGFYTKYGDGGVDVSPIADLYKTQVYDLAKELGVIADIIAAPPTDGLWTDNRTDESQIGATYPELEWAMTFEKNPTDEEMLTVRQREVLSIFRKFNRANRHKMVPIPVCMIPDDLSL